MALKFMPGFSQHPRCILNYEKPGRTYSKYPDLIKLYRKFTQFKTSPKFKITENYKTKAAL